MTERADERVLGIIRSVQWTSAVVASNYVSARAHAYYAVKLVLDRAGFEGAVGGSWFRGDFHLRRDGLQSWSDLDLVLDSAPLRERLRYVHKIESSLAEEGVRLSVSIHPSASFADMSLHDQHFFNMLELLIWSHGQVADYALAKAVLMLSRIDASESGVSAGLRIGLLPELRMKIGVDNALGESDRARAGATSFEGRSLAEWVASPAGGLRMLARHFEQRSIDTQRWIYVHAASKARRRAGELSHKNSVVPLPEGE